MNHSELFNLTMAVTTHVAALRLDGDVEIFMVQITGLAEALGADANVAWRTALLALLSENPDGVSVQALVYQLAVQLFAPDPQPSDEGGNQ